MQTETLLRILRNATHWARGQSKEFDTRVAACLGTLDHHVTETGALTLQGRTDEGAVVSIALVQEPGGPAVALRQCQPITADGFAAILDVQHSLTLPGYLRRQLAQALGRPKDPEPEPVPA